jgi:cysteinyl-tRNA synthetase
MNQSIANLHATEQTSAQPQLIQLYSTLSRTTETLQPIHTPTIGVYTCGPTVYDYAHLGHWFTYVRWDTLIRTLQVAGYQPKWVMNITDVGHLVSDADDGEDKLEKGARREGKTAWEVAEFYAKDFTDGMRALNIQTPTVMPRATDHLAEQIAMVQALEEKGYTYTISDGVYYDTSKFPRYADFAKLDLEEQRAGARVESNPEKRNPTDFALWKFSPQDQKRDMEWGSPFKDPDGQPCKGFPGWHIECSAMSMKYLGETLDIHTGGIDHIPVHHTNEIAQSEAVTGKRFANIWLHSNHVSVNGEKISKSLGNGIRWQQLAEKGYDPLVLRLHILESHYRSQSKFSWESLEAAKNRLQGYRAMAALQYQAKDTAPQINQVLAEAIRTINQHLFDDLDTPQALAKLSAISDNVQASLLSEDSIPALRQLLMQIDSLLGLKLLETPDISPEQRAIIQERETARVIKDWTASDKLRDQLLADGVGVRDTAQGSVWFWL